MRNRPFGLTSVITVAASAAAGIMLGVLVLLILAAVCLSSADPLALTTPLAVASLCLGALFAGSLSAILGRRGHVPFALSGALCGALLILVLSVAAAVPTDSPASVSLPVRCALYLAVLALSVAGAALFRRRERTHASYKSPRRRQRR